MTRKIKLPDREELFASSIIRKDIISERCFNQDLVRIISLQVAQVTVKKKGYKNHTFVHIRGALDLKTIIRSTKNLASKTIPFKIV